MKNTEYILYLDMDGVLVDFEGGYQKKYGKTIKEVAEEEGNKAAYDKWLASGIQFWANLDWLHGGQELLKTATGLFERVGILSSAGSTDPDKFNMAKTGKLLWLKKNAPSLNQSDIHIVERKYKKKLYASKSSILVDDVPGTIKEFNQAGGYGVLHDYRRYKKTIETLEDVARPMNLSEIVKRIRRWYL